MADLRERLSETHIVGDDTRQSTVRAEDARRWPNGKLPMWALAMPQCPIKLCERA